MKSRILKWSSTPYVSQMIWTNWWRNRTWACLIMSSNNRCATSSCRNEATCVAVWLDVGRISIPWCSLGNLVFFETFDDEALHSLIEAHLMFGYLHSQADFDMESHWKSPIESHCFAINQTAGSANSIHFVTSWISMKFLQAMEVYEFQNGEKVVRQGDTDGAHKQAKSGQMLNSLHCLVPLLSVIHSKNFRYPLLCGGTGRVLCLEGQCCSLLHWVSPLWDWQNPGYS